jgi:DNA-binding protein HU-beta
MNKQELIDAMAANAQISKAAAGKALDAFMDSVTSAMAKGDKVTLVGFGTFLVSQRASRKGRNPQTGAVIEIPATKVPKFRPGAELKSSVK